MSLYFLSFGAGILSFLSPCVLPLIPGYISFINGTTLEGLEDKKNILFLKKPYFYNWFFYCICIIGSHSNVVWVYHAQIFECFYICCWDHNYFL